MSRHNSSESSSVYRAAAVSVVALGIVWALSGQDAPPACDGTQRVEVSPDDQNLGQVMSEHIKVSRGFVDFGDVKSLVLRRDNEGNLQPVPDSDLMVGDTVEIPRVCKED